MKTLDRYITRQYLANYLVLMIVIMGVFVIVDLIVDLDEFFKAARLLASQRPGGFLVWLVVVLADWYGPLLLLVYAYFSGLLAVGAMGFTFAGLSRSRELVAIVGGGISLYRVAMPVLLIGALLSLLALPSQEYLIPHLAKKLIRSKSDVAKQRAPTMSVLYMPDDQGNLFSAASYDVQDESLHGVTILRRDRQGRVLQRITADRAFWDAGRLGWDLPGGNAVRPEARGQSGDALQAKIEPIEFFASDLTPRRIHARQGAIFPLLLSLAELRTMAAVAVEHEGEARQFLQIIHSRFSLVIVNMLIMVVGLPFFLTCNPDSILGNAVKAALVCVGAWGVGLLLMFAGAPYLPPLATAWLPVVLYLPLSAIMVTMIRT